jgi:hypothetical protein
MVNQPKLQQEGLTPDSAMGQTQQPTKGLVVQTGCSSRFIEKFEQPSSMNEEEQVEFSVGQSDGAAEGGIADGAQHLGASS